MVYLLDANVLVRAHEDYYPIDRIPQFWVWLASLGETGVAKIPYEIYGEIAVSTGSLQEWLTDATTSKIMLLNQKIDPKNLNTVLTQGYAPDLNDSEIEEIGQDPFLIGYALADTNGVTVVTKEVSAPSKQRLIDGCPMFARTSAFAASTTLSFTANSTSRLPENP